MNAEDFVHWLRGVQREVGEGLPDAATWQSICARLDTLALRPIPGSIINELIAAQDEKRLRGYPRPVAFCGESAAMSFDATDEMGELLDARVYTRPTAQAELDLGPDQG